MSAICEKSFQIILGFPRCSHPEDPLGDVRPVIKDYTDDFFSHCPACGLIAAIEWNGFFEEANVGTYCSWNVRHDIDQTIDGGYLLHSFSRVLTTPGNPWTLEIVCSGFPVISSNLVWRGNTADPSDTPFGTYTRTAGCAVGPATLDLIAGIP